MDEAPTSQRLDEIIEVLADRRRRLLLYYLASEGSVDSEELVSYLCSHDPDRSDHDRVSQEQAVATEIHHMHLPKLRDAEVIEIDDDRDVRFRPPAALEALLPVVRQLDPELDTD